MAHQVGRTSVAEQVWEAWAAILLALAGPPSKGGKSDSAREDNTSKPAPKTTAKNDPKPGKAEQPATMKRIPKGESTLTDTP